VKNVKHNVASEYSLNGSCLFFQHPSPRHAWVVEARWASYIMTVIVVCSFLFRFFKGVGTDPAITGITRTEGSGVISRSAPCQRAVVRSRWGSLPGFRRSTAPEPEAALRRADACLPPGALPCLHVRNRDCQLSSPVEPTL
jgi:hypothetical protein